MKNNPVLEQLAKKYVETKDTNLFISIFKLLEPLLKKKASFIFYQKVFRGNFKLVDMKQNYLEDVRQELNLEVINLLNKYNPKKSFGTYLVSSLWKWTPKFTRKNKFYKYLKNKSINAVDNDGTEFSILDNISQEEVSSDNFIEIFENLTKTETKILNLYQENIHINQSEIAEIIGVTQQRIDQIISGLKKKYIK